MFPPPGSSTTKGPPRSRVVAQSGPFRRPGRKIPRLCGWRFYITISRILYTSAVKFDRFDLSKVTFASYAKRRPRAGCLAFVPRVGEHRWGSPLDATRGLTGRLLEGDYLSCRFIPRRCSVFVYVLFCFGCAWSGFGSGEEAGAAGGGALRGARAGVR